MEVIDQDKRQIYSVTTPITLMAAKQKGSDLKKIKSIKMLRI